IQLIGNDPNALAQAMDILESYQYDAYDLNLGWPDSDALQEHSGGALLTTPELVALLTRTMVNATNKAVSAKIRIGFDNYSINALEIAMLIEQEGADFLTIHGRTVEAGYAGQVNLDIIKAVKDAVTIPVIGNGDIVDGPSADRMFKRTQCDLVMIGRAAMKNPRIFSEINAFLQGDHLPPLSRAEHKKIIADYRLLSKKTNSKASLASSFFKYKT
ncbi:MAG: tRNA-dihydrouridine synthase family protein, partial [Promethearchaeota archaeon]